MNEITVSGYRSLEVTEMQSCCITVEHKDMQDLTVF